MSVSQQWQAAITAVQFLTRVPVPGGMNRPGANPVLLKLCVVYFPLVGGLIGALTGSVIWGALHIWPPLVAVALGLIFEALLTGGFHEDAVADCCDAFGGGWAREDVLRIMKDSRIGSFGALGLLLAVGLRGGCLTGIPATDLIAISAGSAAIGRWGILVLMMAVPPVPDRVGLAKDIGLQTGWTELLTGTLWTLPGLAWCAIWQPLPTGLGVLAVLIGVLCWGAYVRRRIGGITGDCLGCGCYLGQCLFLLCLTARTM